MLALLHALFVLSLPFADLLLSPSLLVGAGQPSTFFGASLFLVLVLGQPRTALRRLSQDRHSWLFLAFLAVATLSTFMSAAAPLDQWKGEALWIKSLKQVLQLGIAFACFAVPVLYLNSSDRFARAIRLFAWTLWLALGYGALEMFHYLGLATMLFPYLAQAVHHGTFFADPDKANLVYLPSIYGFPRLRLLASEPSMAGNYLLSVLPLAFCLARRRQGWSWRLAAAGGVAALVLTFSLGAWVAFLGSTAAAAALLLRDRGRAPKLVVAVFGAGLALAAGGLLLEEAPGPVRILSDVLARLGRSENDRSVAGRLLENRTAWSIFTDYPALGVGIGNWVFHYPGRMSNIPTTYIYVREQTSEMGFQRAAGINNLFLRLLCETGAIGTGAFLLFLIAIGKTTVRLAWSHPALQSLGVALAAGCGALTLHFHSMSAFDKRYWWYLFGLTAAAGRVFLERSRVLVVLPARADGPRGLEQVAP